MQPDIGTEFVSHARRAIAAASASKQSAACGPSDVDA
jgi:hypothetical protein